MHCSAMVVSICFLFLPPLQERESERSAEIFLLLRPGKDLDLASDSPLRFLMALLSGITNLLATLPS